MGSTAIKRERFPDIHQVGDSAERRSQTTRAGQYSSTVKCFYEAISLTVSEGNISSGGGCRRQEGFFKVNEQMKRRNQFGAKLDV